jgi:hypothetical protein
MSSSFSSAMKIWEAVWQDHEKKDVFTLFKHDGTSITLKKGCWVTLPNRTDVCIIDKIYTLNEEEEEQNAIGPLGISYLPWREDEARFATKSFSFKGNPRFIVCYPVGRNHYGIHINWDDLFLCEPPKNIDADLIASILK